MIIEIFSKLLAESLLSLYPTFVKNINLSLGLQLWSRCFSYVIISLFFIDWVFVYNQLFSKNGLLLSAITTLHIYTSYRSFQLLEGGIAYAIFYTYPLMILYLSGEKIKYSIFFALLGVMIIYLNQPKIQTVIVNKLDTNKGYVMAFLAAFTESIIYFLVREIKTSNNWNHLFISYLFGAIAASSYYFQDIMKLNAISNSISLSLIINVIIGLCGYFLRFFAISRLSPSLYAPLSYFGIVMAIIYGYVFNSEIITITQIIGIIFILLGTYQTIKPFNI
jgi:drug/metabolite transporter (DMT)-like permease